MTDAPLLLLVNGNDTQRSTLARFVSRHSSYDIIEARTGPEAVDVLKRLDIRCVISDIDLQGLDGWRLVRMVRSGVFSCSADTPFIMVTSTWCQRIAETTAREFDVDLLLPYDDYQQLQQLLPLITASSTDDKQSRILAVEDAEETAKLIQRILRHRFIVDVAEDGPTGLELWRQHKHSIVLLDVMLPGMSGPEVMDRMLAENPAQTIVIMTAHGSMDLAEELMLKGAADFISKPFRNEQLRKVCEIAARREDFLVSNEQFAETIESLKRNEDALASQAVEHKSILDNLTTAVLELNADGEIVFVNHAWTQLTGMEETSSKGKTLAEFACTSSFYFSAELEHAIETLVARTETRRRLEFKLKQEYSAGAWVEARFNRIIRDNNQLAISVAIDDISARKNAEQRLQYLAMHDSLTGLYNRHYFDKELARIASIAAHNGVPHSLLYIDLDHFKAINDTQGHSQGDSVLKDVATKLSRRLRQTDRLCRIGGDEFTVLLSNTDLTLARRIAEDLCSLVAMDQYTFGEQIFKISCSIGICQIDGSEDNSQNYLQQSDIALYVAKGNGRNSVHIYTAEDKESYNVKSSMKWLHTVQNAMEQDGLLLHFQPVYHIPSNRVSYYEALVRLMIDDQIVYPGDFIPALERFEEIELLDKHVIDKAIKALSENPQLKKVAINLSAQAFRNDDLVPMIKQKLDEYGVEPNRVIFELTESAGLADLSATTAMVEQLSSMGCVFSIDDFGTGFSTFSYLKNLPADTVKIDGSFIKELRHSSIDRALVRSIREVAFALGKKTVAEFVEDHETLELLREIKVEYAQGYYLGKPKPIEQLFYRDVELVLEHDD